MKKAFLVLTIMLFIGVGGFVVVNAMNQGKPAAEQSSFTLKFIDEKSKTKDGFYTFTSKIGQYKMLFPDNYQLSDGSSAYEASKNFYEMWSAHTQKNGNSDYLKTIQLTFTNDEKLSEDYYKTALKNFIYNEEIDQSESSNNVIYMAASNGKFDKKDHQIKTRDPKKYGVNQIGVLVKDKYSNRYIKLDYSIICYKKNESDCSYENAKEKNLVKKISESIVFLRK